MTLAALQLLLYSRYTQDFNDLCLQAVIVAGLLWQVYQKQSQLTIEKDLPGHLLGILLILLLLLRAKYIFLTEASVFGYFVSWFSLMGYILLLAGFKGLRLFRKEMLIGVALTLINPVLSGISFYLERTEQFSVTVISAKLTSFLLWYIGFDASHQGQVVYVNDGAIDIYLGCTGIPLFLELLKFSLLIILLFPFLCRNLSLLLIVPAILSLIFSTIRLAVMAIVVNNTEVFQFWHGPEGSNLFLTIAMLLFFGIIFLTAPPPPEYSSDSHLAYLSPNSNSNFHDHHNPPTPLWLLRSTSFILLIILVNFGVGSPIAGANTIADYQFPLALDLPGWELKQTHLESLVKVKNTLDENQNSIPFDQPLAQRSYRYYNYQKENEFVDINLRCIVNTFGDIKSYYNKVFKDLPPVKESIEVEDQGNYHLTFSHQGTDYLTACINVEGQTTVTGIQFVSYFRRGYVNPIKLVDWLWGKRLLQDRRCLWLELSVHQESSLTDLDRLSLWQSLIDYWRSNFPVFRGSGKFAAAP